MRPRSVAGWIAAAFAMSAGVAAEVPQGEPFAIEAVALVPVDAETAVTIVGLTGRIEVSSHEERDVRVSSMIPAPGPGEAPVGLWAEGSRIIIAPRPGDTLGARTLHVQVPPSFAVAISTSGSDVSLQYLGGGVDVRGDNLRVVAASVSGELDSEQTGGSIVSRDGGDLTLRLHDTSAQIDGALGNVRIRATGNAVTSKKIRGSLDLETEGAVVAVEGVDGPAHLKVRGASATVTGLRQGADIELTGAPLRLSDGKGDITITSDASVEFAAMAASLHLDMYGGTLRGKGNQGILEVRTRNTEVNIESIDQGMRIQGDGLKARIVDVGGELYVEASVSDLFIDRVGSVELRLDGGSATVQRAGGLVQAAVVGGDVHILDGTASVNLDLDGGDAEVSWVSLRADKDSQIVNKSGNVTVRFPAGGVCRVEAKSTYGRVDSELPTVVVLDDFTQAQGPLNGGLRPLVRIVANGDVHLQDASKARADN